ncbi:MAG: hypothetical protein JSV16_03115 [Candidatus Hydrogenedentota bacterium]|nr:MAG: hypothetical protein JSV16_03115 [Candidatus Hydrogenedentota bacterium]
MTVIQTGLFSVMERFSDRKDAVKRLFRESEAFQTVCEDYRKCVEALRFWNESGSDGASARREEYAALLHDLEAEILQSLKELGKRHPL